MKSARSRPSKELPSREVAPRQSSDVDATVGYRLKVARTEKGLSVKDFAALCGISRAQVIKYESGNNRVSASRLKQFSIIVGRDVNWFFLASDAEPAEPARGTTSDQIHELVKEFSRIKDVRRRACVVDFVIQQLVEEAKQGGRN